METFSVLLTALVAGFLLYLVSRMARWLLAFFVAQLCITHPVASLFFLLFAAALYLLFNHHFRKPKHHDLPKLPHSSP